GRLGQTNHRLLIAGVVNHQPVALLDLSYVLQSQVISDAIPERLPFPDQVVVAVTSRFRLQQPISAFCLRSACTRCHSFFLQPHSTTQRSRRPSSAPRLLNNLSFGANTSRLIDFRFISSRRPPLGPRQTARNQGGRDRGAQKAQNP